MTLLGLTAQPTCFKWRMGPIAVLPKDAPERIFAETGGFFDGRLGFRPKPNIGVVTCIHNRFDLQSSAILCPN